MFAALAAPTFPNISTSKIGHGVLSNFYTCWRHKDSVLFVMSAVTLHADVDQTIQYMYI